MNFVTIKKLNSLIYENLDRIPKDIDLVVGVPRSGMLVANLLALYLNVPLTDIDSFNEKRVFSCGFTKVKEEWKNKFEDIKKVIIVEDSCNTGHSIELVKEKVEAIKDKEIIYLAAIVNEQTAKDVDLFFTKMEQPRMFEWNYIHHKGVINACFDIDGVLCRDPSDDENDDGEKYIEFIKNVKPKIIPSYTIGYIITSRLEKYRYETEQWLKSNNIKYENLIMMQYKTKEERIKAGNHGSYKGNWYKHLKKTTIFIESNESQAREINRISGKAVFCTDTQVF